jgi:hypothetical protein
VVELPVAADEPAEPLLDVAPPDPTDGGASEHRVPASKSDAKSATRALTAG